MALIIESLLTNREVAVTTVTLQTALKLAGEAQTSIWTKPE